MQPNRGDGFRLSGGDRLSILVEDTAFFNVKPILADQLTNGKLGPYDFALIDHDRLLISDRAAIVALDAIYTLVNQKRDIREINSPAIHNARVQVEALSRLVLRNGIGAVKPLFSELNVGTLTYVEVLYQNEILEQKQNISGASRQWPTDPV